MVGPDGVVPGMQFVEADGSFGTAMQSIETIFAELQRRYPERYPGGDDADLCERVCGPGDASIFSRLRVARRAYEACAGAADGSAPAALGPPLAAALRDLDTLLADTCEARDRPFFGGVEPSVADLMLLPFLERTAAVVPYFFGEQALDTSRTPGATQADAPPFGRAARYLARARARDAVYDALCSDATTLARTNVRYAAAGAAPRYSVPSLEVDAAAAAIIDGTAAAVRDAWACDATHEARREAAARLAAAPERVAAFARRCGASADDGASDNDGASDDASPADGETADVATDDALRAVAALLLFDGRDSSGGAEAIPTESSQPAPRTAAALHRHAQAMASQIRATRGVRGASFAAAALNALALNVGVPRDMPEPAARALRSHCRILSGALTACGFDAEAARLRARGCTRSDVLVVIDFDLTLTSGTSDECHDIVGTSTLSPPGLRQGFERLLDFSKPFPPELEGDKWWVRANELLVEHGEGIGPELPAQMCRAADIALRPGARELLIALQTLGVPVLIVSAGVTQIIEATLERAGVPTDAEPGHPLLAISSNRLVFSDADGSAADASAERGRRCVGVDPTEPVTSLSKDRTRARNRAWFDELHADRGTLVVAGDRISDLLVAVMGGDELKGGGGSHDGGDERFVVSSCGIFNDTPHGPQPAHEDFAARFDTVVLGDDGSLEPLQKLIEQLPA